MTGDWPQAPATGPLPPVGDATLDAIIARACAPTADQRYATAQAFAADLRAVLDYRPTSMQQRDWRISGRLMARRHPRAVAAASAGVIATLAALVAITVLYIQASHARHLAEKRFEDVRPLAGYMLGDFHDDLLKLPGSTALRERNAAVGSQYLAQLAQDGHVPVDVEREIAIGLARFGNARATSSGDGTGTVKDGDGGLGEAERRLRDLVRRYPGRDDLKRDLAKILAWRSGVIAGEHNDLKGARAAIDESMAIDDAVLKRNPGDIDAAYNRWNTALALGDMYGRQNDWPALKALIGQTQARFANLATPAKYRSQRPMLEAASEAMLGDAAYALIGPEAGMTHYRKSEAIMAAAVADGVQDMRIPQRQAYYDHQLALSYNDLKQPKQALQWADRGSVIIRDLALYDDSPATLYLGDILSRQRVVALRALGRTPEAVTEAQAAVTRRSTFLRAHPQNDENRLGLGHAMRELSDLYAATKQPAKACLTAREAMAVFDEAAKTSAVASHSQGDVDLLRPFIATCPK